LREAALPRLEDDEFYVRDLLGCAVTVDGGRVGVVRDVIASPANDVVEVALADGRTALVPFVADAVLEVAPGEGRVALAPWALEAD